MERQFDASRATLSKYGHGHHDEESPGAKINFEARKDLRHPNAVIQKFSSLSRELLNPASDPKTLQHRGAPDRASCKRQGTAGRKRTNVDVEVSASLSPWLVTAPSSVGRALPVNHAAIARRINSLEKSLGSDRQLKGVAKIDAPPSLSFGFPGLPSYLRDVPASISIWPPISETPPRQTTVSGALRQYGVVLPQLFRAKRTSVPRQRVNKKTKKSF